MRILPVLVALTAWFGLGTACASGPDGAAPDAAGGFVPEADRWDDIMEDVIGPVYDDYLLREAERTDGAMNFTVIADQAVRAANHMALGYGVHEWTDVPRFGEYAREAEAWFREIAAAARAGEAERLRLMIRAGEIDHCDRCHAASG